MNQSERRMYLIKELLKEQPGYRDMEIQKMLMHKDACCVRL